MPNLDPGDRVLHDTFGMGTVVTVEGQAEKAVASVDFGSRGRQAAAAALLPRREALTAMRQLAADAGHQKTATPR